MVLSTMVLCMMDNFYSQLKFEVLCSTGIFTVIQIQIASPGKSERMFEGLYLKIGIYLRVAQRELFYLLAKKWLR